MKHIRLQFILVYLFLFISLCHSSELPEVFTTLLPAPQSVRLLSAEAGIHPQDIVGYCLKNKAEIPFRQDYFPRKLLKSVRKGTILLKIDNRIKEEEGYRLIVSSGKVTVEARTQVGLQYGVQTLVQLAQNAVELNTSLPAFEIKDYPSSSYRAIHIDLKNHMKPKDYLYHILDRMAEYKLNAVVVEYEDKLKYENYPEIALPDALSVEEWSEWAEYAHRLNIDVSPLIQGIGHADFILKHDEYKSLRENPASDWTCCPTNEDYYELQFGLYQTAIRATPHGKYLHVGGDEAPGVGTCPRCKATGKTPLQLQLDWLKRVSDYAEAHGRIPIFWDDILFKGVGLYYTILDLEKSEQQDSIWEARLPELDRYAKLFPRNVIYMRWKYEDALSKGNRLALGSYNRQGLQVMGANAAQTTFAMLPLENGQAEHIRSFHLVSSEIPLKGILCTAWDDSSPLFDTYWKGFIANAQYSWNIAEEMDIREFSRRYLIREFGNTVSSLPDFRLALESAFPLWETGLLDYGVRKAMWKTKGNYKVISLPGGQRGEWSRKYAERLREAERNKKTHDDISFLLKQYRDKAVRNDYSLQVFSIINELTGYTARLLLAVSVYDKDRDKASLNSLRRCMDDFKTIRRNMEELYSRTRTIEQPAGYILPMGYRSRLGLNTPDSSWMFLFELELLAHLDKMLSLYEEPN